MQRVVRDGPSVDQDLAAVRRVVAHQQFEDRSFSSTGVAHHAEELTLVHLERNAVQHFDGRVGVGEVDVVELNRFDAAFKGHGVVFVHDGGFKIDGSKDAPCGGFAALELIDEDAENEHRHGHSRADEQEGDELPGGDFALAGPVPAGGRQQPEGDTCDGVNHRNESVAVGTGAHRLVPVRPGFSSNPVGFPLFSVVRLNDGDARNEVLKHGVDVTGGFSLLSVFALDTGRKPVHGGDDEEDGREQHSGEFPGHQHEDEEGGAEGDEDTDDGS